ncbi:MAG: PBECR4 domain-containing protein [Erysipelotrichaceae bacterium]
MKNLSLQQNTINKLMDITYYFKLGHKNKTVEIEIEFQKQDFHHLLGLHKLRDLQIYRNNREIIINKLLKNQLQLVDLKKSSYFSEIEERLKVCGYLEQLLDGDTLVFRWNKVSYSKIDASFLIQASFKDIECYLFLKEMKSNSITYKCNSVFPKLNSNYERGQMKFAVLEKKKKNRKTGEIIEVYHKKST